FRRPRPASGNAACSELDDLDDLARARIDDQDLVRNLDEVVVAPLRTDLNDVGRQRVEPDVLRDLESGMHRAVEFRRRDLVLAEDADDLAALLGREPRRAGRALPGRAAHVEAAV